ncbi:cytochrome c oxidase subunit II [Platysternon megacephalum]|uniref:Cytochrome c oxidase subunit II n=1 Tax=Platysternon megacephalum TaxID=55544 RepID=A0A4D9DG87_9SAUR|nr:cytochrome c oxidase subunit II [Platysternon megacephalum]
MLSKQAKIKPAPVAEGGASPGAAPDGEAGPEAPKKGEASQEPSKSGEPRQEAPKKGKASPETPKKGEVSPEAPKKEEARQEAPKKGEVSPESPKKGEARQEMPQEGGASQEAPKKPYFGKVPFGPHHWRLVTLILAVCSLVLLIAFLKRETRKLYRVEFRYRRHYSYWIGLIYKVGLKKWVWLDDSPFTLDLSSAGAQAVSNANDACVFFIQGMSHAKDCTLKHYCLCKKTK